MEHTQILMKSLYAKSKSLHIPYENLIAGCGIEKLVEQLFSKKDKALFSLTSDFILGISHYQKILQKEVSIRHYEKDKNPAHLIACLENCLEETDIQLLKNSVQELEDGIVCRIKVAIDLLELEIQLTIKKAIREKSFRIKDSSQSIMDNNRKIHFFQYAREDEIAEKMMHCI